MADLGPLVKAVTEWPARYFFALAFVAVALLLLSHSRWADLAGIPAAPSWFRLSLTVATLAFAAVAFTKGFTHLATRRAAAKAARQQRQAWEDELRSLTPNECAVLARFVDDNVRDLRFIAGSPGAMSAATAQVLALRGHLHLVAREQIAFSTVLDYAIQGPTFTFLRKHPELLQSGRTIAGGEQAGAMAQ